MHLPSTTVHRSLFFSLKVRRISLRLTYWSGFVYLLFFLQSLAMVVPLAPVICMCLWSTAGCITSIVYLGKSHSHSKPSALEYISWLPDFVSCYLSPDHAVICVLVLKPGGLICQLCMICRGVWQRGGSCSCLWPRSSQVLGSWDSAQLPCKFLLHCSSAQKLGTVPTCTKNCLFLIYA